LWPGVAAAVLLVLIRYVLPAVAPEGEVFGQDVGLIAVLGGVVLAVAIIVWWLFFSRAPWSERLIAIGVMILAAIAIRPLTHISIQNGMMGMMFFIYAIPTTLSLAFVFWAVASRGLPEWPRRTAMVVAILIGCGVWTLARTDGLFGGTAELQWRWTPTAEELLLAQESTAPDALGAPGASASARESSPASSGATSPGPTEPHLAEWPGFRGPARDGVVRGVSINTDWSASPPVEMWRRAVGPGWSSFAVSGDFLYTQEQRGDDEIVACYRVSTGEPVWRHRDGVRFWESNGGAGPRGTPTLHEGRVYAFGATGMLNALDAATGRVVWSRNVGTDTGRVVPDWGFASSPLIVDDVVIVAAAGTLVGYDLASGNPRWKGPSYGGSYSSPHRATVEGVVQVVLLGGPGAISVAPDSGAVLWEHKWGPGPIVQPAVMTDGDILVNGQAVTGGLGTRRLHLTHDDGGWNVEERWTSTGLKPYFNDFVVHEGHAYGFDGNILASISLEDGTRRWKGGRYGNGQMILLAEQDLLLVLSEEGELALVSATPDKFTEVARFQVLDAKTWNHPVMVGDVLLVRNGEEMAAFRMPVASAGR